MDTLRLLAELILPPGCGFLLVAAALLIARRRPRRRRVLLGAGLLLLWASATPLLTGACLRSLETFPPLPVAGPLPPADAIVVLSAEAHAAPEFAEGLAPGPVTAQRLRYAAHLHRRTGLPVLTSGGAGGAGRPALARVMADALQADFGVTARWVEDRSVDTWSNAVESAVVLRAAGVGRVLLVTSAFHMPRAVACFRAQGLEVVAAPTGFRGPPWQGLRSLLPSHQAMREANLAAHEWLGGLAYRVLGRHGG